MREILARFAAEQQRHFEAMTLPRTRKQRGHFGTAPAIADFMAGMFTRIPKGQVRILDPGAGVGTLSAALCDRVLQHGQRRQLFFELWENDARLESPLRATMETCRKTLSAAEHAMEYELRIGDFILEHAQPSLFAAVPEPRFDLIVMNPPYFKVRKDSDIARAMAHVVHGQPNIYALFMALAVDLLRDAGEMVAITPRSYFNGPYFHRFRNWFFDRMTARQIHLFESRTEAFQADNVLQENVILHAEKRGAAENVIVTSTVGRNFERVTRQELAYISVIENSTGHRLIRVAASNLEQEIVDAVDQFPTRFRDLPMKISTGPVVTFRAKAFLRLERAIDTAPLLWMHNVRPFVTKRTSKLGKSAHIVVNDASSKLLLPANRYVLLKRFTAKEENRRLVAGVMEAQDSYSPYIGLENHLNYIYKPKGELSQSEAIGLAGLFNSALIDRYFRAISGNTQVNAAEIRAMPLPSLEKIRAIGERLKTIKDKTAAVVERTVGETIGLPKKLIDELCARTT